MTAPEIAVIGGGGWGTALALLLSRRAHAVPLWVHGSGRAREMDSSRVNAAYLPGARLPGNVLPTADLDACSAAAILFVAVPSRHLAAVCDGIARGLGESRPLIVSCTKGIDPERGLLMSEVIGECLPGCPVAVLSGPNLAGEIAAGFPAAGVVACEETALAVRVQSLFEGTPFRAYTGSDVRGVQLGGALKNVFAIAAGVSDGLGLGENARAGLVTRSLAEMTRLGTAMGGERETFGGLGGIGDLMVTCFSPKSRNHGVGFRIGRGEKPEAILGSMTMAAEGVPTAFAARDCARRAGVSAPLIDEVAALLEGSKGAADAMRSLLAREMRPEGEA
jgi:glycerol-3-phosphate dehydrogenase (NAD(P)+)